MNENQSRVLMQHYMRCMVPRISLDEASQLFAACLRRFSIIDKINSEAKIIEKLSVLPGASGPGKHRQEKGAV